MSPRTRSGKVVDDGEKKAVSTKRRSRKAETPVPPEPEPTSSRLTPHPDQELIINALLEHAKKNRSGLVVAPTGYGKSLLIGETIERQAKAWHGMHKSMPGKKASFRTVITVPNLTLARQVIEMAGRQLSDPPRVTICCGDDEVAEAADFAAEDTVVSLDIDTVAERVRHSPIDGRVDLYVSTNQAGVRTLIEGQRLAERRAGRYYPFNLAVVDEAHRTLGDEFSAIHERGNAGLRVSYTAAFSATPVGHDIGPLVRGVDEVKGGSIVPQTYNLYEKFPLVAEYTLADAIAAGRVKEPVIKPVFIRASTIDGLIADRADNPSPFRGMDRATATAAYVLSKAAPRHGLSHVMTFHPTVAATKDMAAALSVLSDTGLGSRFDAQAVHGKTKVTDREAALERFARAPKQGEVKVISNPEVFKEGQNTPVIQAVLLAEPENSVRSNVQAFGRALRSTSKDKQESAYCLIPMVVDDSNPQAPELEERSRKRLQYFLLSYKMADGMASERVQPDLTDLWEGEPAIEEPPAHLPSKYRQVLLEEAEYEREKGRARIRDMVNLELAAVADQTRAISPRQYNGVRWDNNAREWRAFVGSYVSGRGTEMLLDRAFIHPEDAAHAVDMTLDQHGFPSSEPRNFGVQLTGHTSQRERITSEYSGVAYDEDKSSWVAEARVAVAGKWRRVLRFFDSESDAAAARDALLEKYATRGNRNFAEAEPRFDLILLPKDVDQGRQLPAGVEFDNATGKYWSYAEYTHTAGSKVVPIGFFSSPEAASAANQMVVRTMDQLRSEEPLPYQKLVATRDRALALGNVQPEAIQKSASTHSREVRPKSRVADQATSEPAPKERAAAQASTVATTHVRKRPKGAVRG